MEAPAKIINARHREVCMIIVADVLNGHLCVRQHTRHTLEIFLCLFLTDFLCFQNIAVMAEDVKYVEVFA